MSHAPKKISSVQQFWVWGRITARGLTKLHISDIMLRKLPMIPVTKSSKKVTPAFSHSATSTDLTATKLFMFLSNCDEWIQQDGACAHIKDPITWLKKRFITFQR